MTTLSIFTVSVGLEIQLRLSCPSFCYDRYEVQFIAQNKKIHLGYLSIYNYDRNTCSWTQVEMVEPAITGTRNVLNACLEAKVNKVVVVSSVAAVMLNPNWPKDQPMDENSWGDTEFCKSTEV